MKVPTIEEKPAFLRTREWEYIIALIETDGDLDEAAEKLGVKKGAVYNKLSVIRLKVASAQAFNRKYKSVIARRK